MGRLPDLTPAELEIMDILWTTGEASGKQIHAVLSDKRKIAYTTVATVLTRLKEKGYVDARELNFAYTYKPLVTREQVQTRKLDDLINDVLQGSLSPIAAYIAKNRKLSEEDIRVLEQILERGGEVNNDEQ
ncbi:MAG: BlaI/MecI/CopY family transcriptional regulator [Armatimonadota bacterium]